MEKQRGEFETNVNLRCGELSFVLQCDPLPVDMDDVWWIDEQSRRRRKDIVGSWLLPFVPPHAVDIPGIMEHVRRGPIGASAMAKYIRAAIRKLRKEGSDYDHLLESLYGVCVMADFAATLDFEGIDRNHMAQYVDKRDFRAVQIAYDKVGYHYIASLRKTDVKWLVERFGEPRGHASVEALLPNAWPKAVARYCWHEYRRSATNVTMTSWLHGFVTTRAESRDLERQRFNESRPASAKRPMSKSAAWNATRNKFIVADIETTGLSAERHEIIEIAALRVAPNGKVLDTFSTLVHAAKPIRAITTRITGITQTDIDRKGVPIGKAMSQLIAFVGDLPMFCHNAPFDCEFLGKASDVARLPFTNVVYDTIPLAKQVWPYLRSYKLAMLARRLGASAPKHRALADARSTLGVLLAARLAFDESNNSPLL